jgi:hypothetical protein
LEEVHSMSGRSELVGLSGSCLYCLLQNPSQHHPCVSAYLYEGEEYR